MHLLNDSWYPGDPDGVYVRCYRAGLWLREIVKGGRVVRTDTSKDGTTWMLGAKHEQNAT